MRVTRDPSELRSIDTSDLTLSVGNFDGVHRGHRAVLSELASSAASRATPAVVVTFEPHPLDVVGGRRPIGLLSPGTERENLIEAAGVDVLLEVAFTQSVARLSAQEFLSLLSVGPGSHLVLGYDFHMGSGRGGDIRRMSAIGESVGFGLDVVPPVTCEGRPISSSRIREELVAGNLAAANAMLGREYLLVGEVVPGAGRGRELGYPTLNLRCPDRKLLPADGVYLARVGGTGSLERAGLVYVGRRPTVEDGGARRAEIHLLGGPPEREGRPAAALLERIRGDREFGSAEELARGIAADVHEARRLLGEMGEDIPTFSF